MEIVDNPECLGRHTREPYEDHIIYTHAKNISCLLFSSFWFNVLSKQKYHVGKHAHDFINF
mgnify:CR=1 FL=1